MVLRCIAMYGWAVKAVWEVKAVCEENAVWEETVLFVTGQKRQKVDAKFAPAFCRITKSYDFLTLQKAMDKTLSIAFYARITTGKKSNQTDGSLHCCLQSITQFPDEITKAHKIRHTLYNVSSVPVVQSWFAYVVDLSNKCASSFFLWDFSLLLYSIERDLSILAVFGNISGRIERKLSASSLLPETTCS